MLKATSIISLWILLIGLFVFFPRQEKQPVLQVTEIKSHVIPHAELETTTTTDCLIVRKNYTAENGVLHLVLSSFILEQLNYETMLHRIKNAKSNEHARSLALTGEKNTSFCGLNSNTTYYLYYFEDIKGVRSHLDMLTLQTKIQENIFDQIFQNEMFIPITTTVFLSLFLTLVLSRRGRKRMPSEKLKAMSSYNYHQAAAERVKGEWKLNLPEACEIRMKRQTGKHPLVEKKSDGEIQNVNRYLEDDNREFEDRRTCGLCCERPREVIFLECGHIYSCAKCAKELVKCPIDNKQIKRVFRFRVCDKHGIKDTIIPELNNNSLESLANSAPNAFFKSIKRELNTYEQYIVLKEQHDNYDYFYKCIMCDQKQKDTLFLDCCHLVCCSSCAHGLKRCPIDNVPISQAFPVYFA